MVYYLNKVFVHSITFYDRSYDYTSLSNRKFNRKDIILLKICLRYTEKMITIWRGYFKVSLYIAAGLALIFFLIILPYYVLSSDMTFISSETIEHLERLRFFIVFVWLFLAICAAVSLVVVEGCIEEKCDWVFKRDYNKGGIPEGMMIGDYIIGRLESRIR